MGTATGGARGAPRTGLCALEDRHDATRNFGEHLAQRESARLDDDLSIASRDTMTTPRAASVPRLGVVMGLGVSEGFEALAEV